MKEQIETMKEKIKIKVKSIFTVYDYFAINQETYCIAKVDMISILFN